MAGKDCSNKVCIDKPADDIKPKFLENYLNKKTKVEEMYPERPLYRSEIGKISWRVFHRNSVMVSDEEDKKHFNNFVNGIKSFFPCPTCREDFQHETKKHPLSNVLDKLTPENNFKNDALINWVCFQHNLVNKKINKPEFKCNIKDLREFYYK